MRKTIQLHPVFRLSREQFPGELVAFGIGHDQTTHLAWAMESSECADAGGQGKYSKMGFEKPHRYRIVSIFREWVSQDLMIEDVFNIHHIQDLPGGILLAGARCWKSESGEYAKNGRIFDKTGRLAGEIILCDAIQCIQTTAEGVIWTSYFDEGAMGNKWGHSGLAAWNIKGEKLHEYQPSRGLGPINDCYAMNGVSSDEVWIYYYTEFPLVKLKNGRVQDYWKMPLRGSDGFAVFGKNALFRGGYEEQDVYRLFRLNPRQAVELIAEIELLDDQGENIVAQALAARGDAICLISNNNIYRLTVADAMG